MNERPYHRPKPAMCFSPTHKPPSAAERSPQWNGPTIAAHVRRRRSSLRVARSYRGRRQVQLMMVKVVALFEEQLELDLVFNRTSTDAEMRNLWLELA
jgi:hypothetical protein